MRDFPLPLPPQPHDPKSSQKNPPQPNHFVTVFPYSVAKHAEITTDHPPNCPSPPSPPLSCELYEDRCGGFEKKNWCGSGSCSSAHTHTRSIREMGPMLVNRGGREGEREELRVMKIFVFVHVVKGFGIRSERERISRGGGKVV